MASALLLLMWHAGAVGEANVVRRTRSNSAGRAASSGFFQATDSKLRGFELIEKGDPNEPIMEVCAVQFGASLTTCLQ